MRAGLKYTMNRDIGGNLLILTGYSTPEIAQMRELPKDKLEEKVFADLGEMANVIHNGYGYYGEIWLGHDCVYLKIGGTCD